MINVLSIIHFPVFGGPHNRNLHVARILRTEGVNTWVLLPDEPSNAVDRLRGAGVDVIQIPLRRVRATKNLGTHLSFACDFWPDIKRLREIIRDRHINVVQINGLMNPHGAIAAKLEGVSVVWQILDTYPPMAVRRAVMPLVNRLADVLMCTGIHVARAHPGAIAKGERLVYFFPPVDLAHFRPEPKRRTKARQELGLEEGTLVVGNVSNINPQKGHLTFIRAAAELHKQTPEVKFVILGATYENHGEYTHGLWREAGNLGLVLGKDLIVYNPAYRVAELACAFDVFWMTSEPRSEGISTAVEEAMALGLPVVTTDVGSMAEIVLKGETGYVSSPHDAGAVANVTLRLLGNPYLRKRMGQRAREFALTHFSAEACAERHLAAYQLALGSRFSPHTASQAFPMRLKQ